MPHKDPEQRKAYNRAYRRRKRKENPQHFAALHKWRYENNVNGYRDKMIANYHKHKEKRLAQQKEYHQRNPASRERYRAKMKNQGGYSKRAKREVHEMSDNYIISLMCRGKKREMVNADLIRKHPELIKAYRTALKLKRLAYGRK